MASWICIGVTGIRLTEITIWVGQGVECLSKALSLQPADIYSSPCLLWCWVKLHSWFDTSCWPQIVAHLENILLIEKSCGNCCLSVVCLSVALFSWVTQQLGCFLWIALGFHRAVENAESARSVIYAIFSAHTAYFNVSGQKVPYFNVSRQNSCI